MNKNNTKLISHDGNMAFIKSLQMSVLSIKNDIPTHIHVQGLRGTGKTTIIRSMKQFLPEILRIKGCQYNCHPERPICPEHKDMDKNEIQEIGSEYIKMPFLEISHSAKIGTIVGSIDLGKIADKNNPVASLLPGSLPRANRGIVFIDEINRLADTSPELVDVLLDIMGTKPGRIQIEETGLTVVEMPLDVCIWAASNPDEEPGSLEDIRKQLSDRFDLVVDVERPKEVQIIKDILSIRMNEYDGNRQFLYNNYDIFNEGKIQVGLNEDSYDHVIVPKSILDILGHIYIDYDIESIRGMESLLFGAKLHTLLNKRKSVSMEDIYFATPLALKHRTDISTLAKIMRYIENYPMKVISKNETETDCKESDYSDIECSREMYIDRDRFDESNIKKIPFYKRVLNYIKERLKKYDKSYNDPITNPNMIKIKSAPQKAIPIKELEIKNVVKTEEELHGSETNLE